MPAGAERAESPSAAKSVEETTGRVLACREEEALRIGDGIIVNVLEIAGSRVRLGVTAPREISIYRQELHARVKREGLRRNPAIGDQKPCSPLLGPEARLQERAAISDALLAAAASLAQGEDARGILQRFCDALVAASPRIRLAWMWLGHANPALIRPLYAVGPARAYAEGLVLGADEATRRGPSLQALSGNAPVLTQVRTDPAFAPWRTLALHYGLEASATFPFADAGNGVCGLVSVYADLPEYFKAVDPAPLAAFRHLAEAALAQAALRQRLETLATFDPLTGLLNRGAMQEVLEHTHALAARHDHRYCLLLIDLDRFKLVNDGYGHAAGDAVIRQVSGILRRELRAEDYAGRWGGEEFLCLLQDADCAYAGMVADHLRTQIAAEPFRTAEGKALGITASVGLVCFPTAGTHLATLLSRADASLYEAKRQGRNRVVRASDEMRGGIFFIGNQIEAALAQGTLRPAYQPIVSIQEGEVVAHEALARIAAADGVLLEAAQFVEVASRLQLLHRIDHAIVRQVIDHCSAEKLAGAPSAPYLVNISADLLRHPELVDDLLQHLTRDTTACCSQCGPLKPLVIEITERELIGDPQEAKRILAPLLDFGVRIALDDFGSGYSSFHYLMELPFSMVKIDQALVQQAGSPRGRRILTGIRDIARDLGLITIAEGVETARLRDQLAEIGIDWAQGHYYAAPRIVRAP